jgi:hypothetical protein
LQLDAFAIRLVFLALPGILALKVYRKLRGPTPKEVWESFLEILLFSLLSYVILGIISGPYRSGGTNTNTTQPGYEPYAVQAVFDPKLPLDWRQIAWACLIALALAAIASALHNYRIVNRTGRFIRLSCRMADEDVWELFFSSPTVRWILVRDHRNALAYFGLARYYSDSGKDREIVLERVDVYNNDDGKKLYEMEAVYLSLDKDDVSIQIPIASSSTTAKKGDSDAK